MTPEKREFPNWANRDRQRDLEWIRQNLPIFWPVAIATYKEIGRGAIVIDTTSKPTGEGHPFGYIPQELVEQEDDEDIKRLVKEYDPEKDLVLVLLKANDRVSSYRIHLPLKK
jgi:hypothetical protein